jgi:hypothetical protein
MRARLRIFSDQLYMFHIGFSIEVLPYECIVDVCAVAVNATVLRHSHRK